MRYPHVTFRVSKTKDLDTAKGFVKEAKYSGGRNLEWAFFSKWPELREKLYDENAFNRFVREQYAEPEWLATRLARHEVRWRKVEARYFALVARLFPGRPWPKGKYTAYGTLWAMYPRFLDDKTFQIPFEHNNLRYVTVVIAHELLHFMFYDYFYARFPKYRAKKHNFFVWHVSEIFNTVVQNSPGWVRVFREPSMGYPEHARIVRTLAKKYAAGAYPDVDALTDAILVAVQKAGTTLVP